MRSGPDTSHLSLDADVVRALDEVRARVADARRSARLADGWRRGLREGIRETGLVAALALLAALLLRASGAPAPSAWWLVLPVVLYAPLRATATAALNLRERLDRRQLLGLADEHLGLRDRLVAADEFVRLPARGPFHRAALQDGLQAAHRARTAPLALARDTGSTLVHASRALPIAAALLAVALLLGELPGADANDGDLALAQVQEATPYAPDSEVRADAGGREVPEPPAPAPARRNDERPPAAAPEDAAGSLVELERKEKPSSGEARQGKGGEARGTSGASQARGAPTGEDPEAREPSEAKPRETTRRPAAEEDRPEEVERPAQEDSGSTAGKGSSRGSNRNPVTSSWKSRDQVTTEDDAEVEDDTDTEDDEEEQENRGGVQPWLRDRRPPVSRDLQIGFGNRPNPDANGRGGPSQPKKSRGVASLVLGVPIPDRVKGRPGPGRTKITQERIEPEPEEAVPAASEARAPRVGRTDGPPPLELDPELRRLVRTYFLRAPAGDGQDS